MTWLSLLSYVFGGAFLMNALPHLSKGVAGERFQSPFAKPPGEGRSSSTVNFVWGFVNLAIGYVLVCRVGVFDLRDTADVLAFGLGVLIIGLLSARQFGRFNGGNAA
jgi:hypothetical protein